MVHEILLLISIFSTSAFGALTIFMGYRALQKLTEGRIKDYGMKVWYALVLFSVGGAFNSYQLLFDIDSVFGIELAYFEYFLYSAYYIVLLFAVFSLLDMSRSMGFRKRSKEMVEAMASLTGSMKNDD